MSVAHVCLNYDADQMSAFVLLASVRFIDVFTEHLIVFYFSYIIRSEYNCIQMTFTMDQTILFINLRFNPLDKYNVIQYENVQCLNIDRTNSTTINHRQIDCDM